MTAQGGPPPEGAGILRGGAGGPPPEGAGVLGGGAAGLGVGHALV